MSGTHWPRLVGIFDPCSGDRPHRPPIDAIGTANRLATLDEPVEHRRDDRAIGLLCRLDAEGPIAVRDLLSRYDLCESDLHGLCGELRAAGLIEEATVAGERGYATTERAETVLEEVHGA